MDFLSIIVALKNKYFQYEQEISSQEIEKPLPIPLPITNKKPLTL